jgi:hypothetical protein
MSSSVMKQTLLYDPETENLYNLETIRSAAEFHDVSASFVEGESAITISVPFPQTNSERGRNYRFWKWFFDTAMRNLVMSVSVSSCEFVYGWKEQEGTPLSRWQKFLKFLGWDIASEIKPATGEIYRANIGMICSVYRGIVLQIDKSEYERLSSLGLDCVEYVKEAAPYRLLLFGNVLNVGLLTKW